MSDNDNKCPLCGKDTHEDEVFCRDCREMAENAYPAELLASEEKELQDDNKSEVQSNIEEKDEGVQSAEPVENDSGEVEETAPTRSNKRIWIFVAIACILLVAAGIAGSLNNYRIKNSEETEIAYWNKTTEENTPLGYSKYLVRYPEGLFKDEAYNRIKELRNREKEEWEAIRNSNDVDALFIYLADNKNSPYKSEIQAAIDSLSWVTARKQNTADAYQAYLGNIELGRLNGEYKEQAQERYDYLSQMKTLEGDSLEQVKTVLTSFFKAFSSADRNGFQRLSTDTLIRFYSTYNQPSKDIIDSLKADYRKNKIRSMLYTPLTDSIEAIMDNKGICFVSVPVMAETTFTNRRQKKETSKYNVKIELTDDKLLRLIHKQ